MAGTSPSASLCLGVERSFLGRRWTSVTADPQVVADIKSSLSVSDSVAHILAARGFKAGSADSFLNPTLKALMPDPSGLADMDNTVDRLVAAIDTQESITVFGDYDVDGATSSALLVRFFRSIGAEIGTYIPDRMKEGYGPNEDALLALKAQGTDVVITVDCGITAFDPLAAAANAGLDVIIIDHHKAEPELPIAAAVVNPNRLDDSSGQGHLAAVGVTFLVLVALNRRLRMTGWYDRNGVDEPDLRHWLDLVALGTVCDVVPLHGLNRAYVNAGLAVMAKGKNAGLNALAEVARVTDAPRAFHFGYLIGPRVNAGGRVGEASLGTRILSTEDPDEASVLALRLDEHNAHRKDIEAAVLMEALEQAETFADDNQTLIFVTGEKWHPGVIGIVASRLRERYERPACVVAIDGGMAKGSGRSVPGVDLGSAVLEAAEAGLLFNGGGHAMAAGFTVEHARLESFRDFLTDRIAEQVNSGGVMTVYDIDTVIALDGASPALLENLSRLEPYGSGNAEPIIAIADVDVVQSDIVGNGHVRAILSGRSGGRLKAIAFNSADSELGYALLNTQGRSLHLAGHLRLDTWQGRANVQLVVDDGAWAS